MSRKPVSLSLRGGTHTLTDESCVRTSRHYRWSLAHTQTRDVLTADTWDCVKLDCMTKPRSYYVDSEHARYYHITSRCVRRAWLMGEDPLTGADHEFRKTILLHRIKHLSRFFAVEIMGYALMSNHFHLVVRYDPKQADTWSDEEVARRWCAAFNRKPLNCLEEAAAVPEEFDNRQTVLYHAMLLQPKEIERRRKALGSISRFMQHLKQPFAVWTNREEGCRGHFFEARFYSGALLNEEDLLACMAYVDLNPVEAGIAHNLRQAENTSIHERLLAHRFDASDLEEYLAALWQDEDSDPPPEGEAPRTLRCTVREYAVQLNDAIVYLCHPNAEYPTKVSSWMARLLNRKRQRRSSAAPFFDYT